MKFQAGGSEHQRQVSKAHSPALLILAGEYTEKTEHILWYQPPPTGRGIECPSKISDTKESDEKASSSPLQSESNADWWSPLFLPSLLPPVWPSPNLLTFWTPTLPKESSVVYLNIFEWLDYHHQNLIESFNTAIYYHGQMEIIQDTQNHQQRKPPTMVR